MSFRRFLVIAVFAAAASAQTPARNVILISIDQCQADRLHVYGNPRATSPNLDRMAAEGMRFSRFYSAAPWTAPSYSAMMTSQYPSRHGVTIFFPRQIEAQKPDAIMLAELFKKAGYQTAAFVNNSVAGKTITGRGFSEYDEGQLRATSITERSTLKNDEFKAPATTERVTRWLGQSRPSPFFLFVLYFEPHSPYDPSPEHDLFKSDAYPDEVNRGYDVKAGRLFRWANLRDAKAIERMTELYDGKIHFIDSYVGKLLDYLRANGLADNTVVFLTSDHGELLYSHPDDFMTFDHRSLYDQVMHVPGIVWGAGVPHGKVTNALATHIDIAPTLLELTGLTAKSDAQGKSLVPLMQGREKTVHDYLFGEQDVLEPLRSVRDERYKLILNERTGRKQLFDDQQDPVEHNDISQSKPEIATRLGGVLDRWRKENEPDPAALDKRWRELAAAGRKVETVDEVTTGSHLQLTGLGWHMTEMPKNFNEGAYWTEPAAAGETPKKAIWRVDNPMLGRYRISVWYGGIPDGKVATDAPYTVRTRHGDKPIRIDQTRNTGQWNELGTFDDPWDVVLANTANGRIIVDAVKFERVD